MRFEAIATAASDGHLLALRRFPAIGARRGVVVIGSATAVVQRIYEPFATFLSDHGLEVWTLDYRGIGGSRRGTLRGFPGTMHDWAARDLEAVLAAAHASAGGSSTADPVPLRFVGHSFGGQALGLAPSAQHVSSTLLVAAQSGYWRLWSGFGRLKMAALWYLVFPLVPRLFGYVPGWMGMGEDLPAGVALEWARWGRQPAYIVALRPEAAQGYASVRGPVLAWSFTDDAFFAPAAAVDGLCAHYTGAAVTRRHYAPADVGRLRIGHWGSFRASGDPTLWDAALRFLTQGSLPPEMPDAMA